MKKKILVIGTAVIVVVVVIFFLFFDGPRRSAEAPEGVGAREWLKANRLA